MLQILSEDPKKAEFVKDHIDECKVLKKYRNNYITCIDALNTDGHDEAVGIIKDSVNRELKKMGIDVKEEKIEPEKIKFLAFNSETVQKLLEKVDKQLLLKTDLSKLELIISKPHILEETEVDQQLLLKTDLPTLKFIIDNPKIFIQTLSEVTLNNKETGYSLIKKLLEIKNKAKATYQEKYIGRYTITKEIYPKVRPDRLPEGVALKAKPGTKIVTQEKLPQDQDEVHLSGNIKIAVTGIMDALNAADKKHSSPTAASITSPPLSRRNSIERSRSSSPK